MKSSAGHAGKRGSKAADALEFGTQRLFHPLGTPLAAGDTAYIGTVHAQVAGDAGVQTTISSISRQFATFSAVSRHH